MKITINKKIKLTLQNPAHYQKIPSRYYFQRWIKLVLGNKIKNTEITIRIVNEKESAALNKTYRHKSGPTNILSFPFDPPPGITVSILGDLVICAPVVAKEAKQQHKSLIAHWAHLTIHGVLHLLGHDHIKDNEAEIMENIEITLLKQLGYPDPYENKSAA
jgi:probable rRNA maturation factor